jgi:RHS repeat-associated protein
MMAEENTGITEVAGIEEIEAYGYTKDVRGSSMELMDSDGEVAVSYQYSDYGETTIRETDPMMPPKNERMYAGEIYDEETGNYYNTARFYRPEDARFLTQDSYRGDESSESWNLYVYCTGNPICFTDPTGHRGKSIHDEMSKHAFRKCWSEIRKKVNKIDRKKARNNLLEGSVYPDQHGGDFENLYWHGYSDYDLRSEEQKTAAITLWGNKNYYKALIEIGKGLHTIQDRTAHHVAGKSVGKIIGNKDAEIGSVKLGKNFLSKYIGKYGSIADNSGKQIISNHEILADCINANYKNGTWVWVKQYKRNPRIKDGKKASLKYLRKFLRRV